MYEINELMNMRKALNYMREYAQTVVVNSLKHMGECLREPFLKGSTVVLNMYLKLFRGMHVGNIDI